ncbi:MAG: hypothetical protein ACPGJV_00375 [Bacteriovoracaceae bacterium]
MFVCRIVENSEKQLSFIKARYERLVKLKSDLDFARRIKEMTLEGKDPEKEYHGIDEIKGALEKALEEELGDQYHTVLGGNALKGATAFLAGLLYLSYRSSPETAMTSIVSMFQKSWQWKNLLIPAVVAGLYFNSVHFNDEIIERDQKIQTIREQLEQLSQMEITDKDLANIESIIDEDTTRNEIRLMQLTARSCIEYYDSEKDPRCKQIATGTFREITQKCFPRDED